MPEGNGTVDRNSLGYKRIALLQKRIHRRVLLGGAASAAAVALLAACGDSIAPSATPAASTGAATVAPTTAAAATVVPTRAPVSSVATMVSGAAPTGATGSTAPSPATASSATLPADAAPPDQQVYIVNTTNEAKVLDFYEAVYARPIIADLFSEPLVRLNNDYELTPGSAESWKASDDGKTWTFKIAPGLVHRHGNPDEFQFALPSF